MLTSIQAAKAASVIAAKKQRGINVVNTAIKNAAMNGRLSCEVYLTKVLTMGEIYILSNAGYMKKLYDDIRAYGYTVLVADPELPTVITIAWRKATPKVEGKTLISAIEAQEITGNFGYMVQEISHIEDVIAYHSGNGKKEARYTLVGRGNGYESTIVGILADMGYSAVCKGQILQIHW